MSSIKHFFYNYLIKYGFTEGTAKTVNMLCLLILSLIICYITDRAIRSLLRGMSLRIAKTTKTNFDNILIKNKLPRNVAHIVPALLFLELIPIVFSDYEYWSKLFEKATAIFIVIFALLIVRSILHSVKDFLKTLPRFKDKPIASYIQVFMIFAWLVGIILAFVIITEQSILTFFTGLGAISAVIILIFRDTILGFVASIQVAVNDMVRIGDWITFDKFGADGDVIEITLATVKVQNFDKTITTIPTYALISDSFKNWRGMMNSDGRRIKRSINIKQHSINFLDKNQVEKLKYIQLIKEYIENQEQKIIDANQKNNADKTLLVNGRNLTNIGVFRKYAQSYIQQHPAINKDMTIMVRQLAPTTYGLPIEIYAFSNDKVWQNYEYIMADIFDHLLAAISYFDLEIFEFSTKPNN